MGGCDFRDESDSDGGGSDFGSERGSGSVRAGFRQTDLFTLNLIHIT